jgi:hypothetical protein
MYAAVFDETAPMHEHHRLQDQPARGPCQLDQPYLVDDGEYRHVSFGPGDDPSHAPFYSTQDFPAPQNVSRSVEQDVSFVARYSDALADVYVSIALLLALKHVFMAGHYPRLSARHGAQPVLFLSPSF